jgi:hypothetical protein
VVWHQFLGRALLQPVRNGHPSSGTLAVPRASDPARVQSYSLLVQHEHNHTRRLDRPICHERLGGVEIREMVDTSPLKRDVQASALGRSLAKEVAPLLY